MISEIPIINEELKNHLLDFFGREILEKYLEKIITPMEDYTLHVYRSDTKIDEIIENLEINGFKAYQHRSFKNIIISMPVGPFDLKRLENSKEIIVDNRAAEMVYQGSDVFVPGVKRANRVRIGDDVNIFNQNKILVANAKALMSHNQMLEQKNGVAAKTILSPFRVPSLELLKNKNIAMYFQSIPAYLASLNLDSKPGDAILDCCAAPGNKTFHINELTEDKAKIVAVDRSKKRIERIKRKITEYKVKNISAFVGNIIELSKNWDVKFDKILIDPPCSSLGLRPRLVHDIEIKTINAIADYQKAIFYACDKLLKTNGTIIYSTCTITKEENENIIDHAVKKMKYEVVEQEHFLSKTFLPVKDLSYPVQRFLPGIDRTPGYFIAKLQKLQR